MVTNAQKAPSGQVVMLVCVTSFFSSIAFIMLGFTPTKMLNTTPAWLGPAIIVCSILFGLVGIYSAPKAIRHFVSKKGKL